MHGFLKDLGAGVLDVKEEGLRAQTPGSERGGAGPGFLRLREEELGRES